MDIAGGPPRLPGQPIFYPVTSEEYVKKSFMDKYPIQKVGGCNHTEWWVPAEYLEELNDSFVGIIEVIGEYR